MDDSVFPIAREEEGGCRIFERSAPLSGFVAIWGKFLK